MRTITKALIIMAFLLTVLPEGKAQLIVDSKHVVRVMSFNILHGATTKGNFDLDYLSRMIMKYNPDLVALQEVDFHTNRIKKLDLAKELENRTGMASVFGKAMDYDDGEYGEAILSKYGIINTRNVPLPYSGENEPRTLLEVMVILPSGDTILFSGTHLDNLEEGIDRLAQAKKLNEVYANPLYPVILAGDFNCGPGSIPFQLLEDGWFVASGAGITLPTYPSEHPETAIDHVMCRPREAFRVINREVACDLIASDHCAVIVSLELIKN